MFGNISVSEFNVKVDNEKINISYKTNTEESKCEKMFQVNELEHENWNFTKFKLKTLDTIRSFLYIL